MDASRLLILTGAIGFVGFKTLLVALEAGYQVRVVVRSAMNFGDMSLTPEMYNEIFVQTSRRATVDLLESTRKAGTVKRVVMTGSIVGNVPLRYCVGQGDGKDFHAENRIALKPAPYEVEFHFERVRGLDEEE
ncbi:NAD(P)-binding protein [Penicillium sp. IBT 16267x]|nr:NAD(P)-binding protein [Penicillium sp. IBT 16267x]